MVASPTESSKQQSLNSGATNCRDLQGREIAAGHLQRDPDDRNIQDIFELRDVAIQDGG